VTEAFKSKSAAIPLHIPEFTRRGGETRDADRGIIHALFDIVNAASKNL
jgi:hypothetical protein